MEREVAQAGSALGLGPRGRRFESCLPDKHEKSLNSNVEAFVFFGRFKKSVLEFATPTPGCRSEATAILEWRPKGANPRIPL